MSLYDQLMEMGAFPQYAARPGQSGDLAPAYGGREADEMLLALQFMQSQANEPEPVNEPLSLFDDLRRQIEDLQAQLNDQGAPDAGLNEYLSWPEQDESGPFRGIIDERMGDESGPFRGPSSTYVPPPPPWGRHDPGRVSPTIRLDPSYEWGPRARQPLRQPGLSRRPRTAPLRAGTTNRRQIGTSPRYSS